MLFVFSCLKSNLPRWQRTIIIELASKWRWRRKGGDLEGKGLEGKEHEGGAQQITEILSAALSAQLWVPLLCSLDCAWGKEMQVLLIKRVNDLF